MIVFWNFLWWKVCPEIPVLWRCSWVSIVVWLNVSSAAFFGQNKRAGGEGGNREAEEAEQLLLTNKSLTDLTTILTQLVMCTPCYDKWTFRYLTHLVMCILCYYSWTYRYLIHLRMCTPCYGSWTFRHLTHIRIVLIVIVAGYFVIWTHCPVRCITKSCNVRLIYKEVYAW